MTKVRMGKGRLVRLRENTIRMAYVARTVRGLPGGRELDRELAGFRLWNVADLEEVPLHSPLRRYFH